MQTTYKKTNEEISKIYVQVSGQVGKIRDYLAGKGRNIVTWNQLEDLALAKPENSM